MSEPLYIIVAQSDDYFDNMMEAFGPFKSKEEARNVLPTILSDTCTILKVRPIPTN